MTNEEKQLLLKDLCARLPYGVKITDGLHTVTLKVRIDTAPATLAQFIHSEDLGYYLRPMSSMTEEEKKEFDEFVCIDEEAWNGDSIQGYINQAEIMSDGIDYLLAHHFDYRGLIEKGLALEAPKDMYSKGE